MSRIYLCEFAGGQVRVSFACKGSELHLFQPLAPMRRLTLQAAVPSRGFKEPALEKSTGSVEAGGCQIERIAKVTFLKMCKELLVVRLTFVVQFHVSTPLDKNHQRHPLIQGKMPEKESPKLDHGMVRSSPTTWGWDHDFLGMVGDH